MSFVSFHPSVLFKISLRLIYHVRVQRCWLFILIAATFGSVVQAVPAPYVSDSNTLFLFHFDESYGGSVTANVGSFGGNAYSIDETTATTTPANVTDVFGF